MTNERPFEAAPVLENVVLSGVMTLDGPGVVTLHLEHNLFGELCSVYTCTVTPGQGGHPRAPCDSGGAAASCPP